MLPTDQILISAGTPVVLRSVPAEPESLWLWLDTETSGLLETQPAVLEASWMITTVGLVQLTPLRSRLAGITYPGTSPLVEWISSRFVPDVATMHNASGLQADWTAAARRLTAIGQLDDLIESDLDVARRAVPPSGAPLHLAGAGVARFEAQLLPALGSRIPNWCHYRPADTSVAAMVAGMPAVTEVCAEPLLELDVPDEASAAAFIRPHRAAADVRAAYATARRLRSLGAVSQGTMTINEYRQSQGMGSVCVEFGCSS